MAAAEDGSDLEIDLSEGDSAPTPRRAAAATYDDDNDGTDFDSDEAGSEGFVDLSTFLADGQGYPSSEDGSDVESGAEEAADAGSALEDGMDMEAEDDEGVEDSKDDDEEDDDDDDDDEDEDDDDAQDKLASLIMGLPSKRKTAPGDSDDEDGAAAGSSRTKRRVLKDRNEEGRKEGSFGAPLNASAFNESTMASARRLRFSADVAALPCHLTASKLSLQTLLAPLPAAQSSSLLNSTRALAVPNSGAALPAPLPTRAQDKLDREAAYEATKGEVTKWGASMKRIKEVCRSMDVLLPALMVG